MRMNHKKQINDCKVPPELHPIDSDNDGSLSDSISLELTKFQNLLAQYKAKVFEKHAHLFQS